MSSIFGIIRIAAVVGLSAIKVVSTCLKFKEAKEQGLINPVFMRPNNSTPYNNNQPMNNNAMSGSINNQYYSHNEDRWHDCTFETGSRRNVCATPQTTYTTQPVQQQPVTSCGGYNMMNNGYNYNNNNYIGFDLSSRRWNNNPYASNLTQYPYAQQSYNNYQSPPIYSQSYQYPQNNGYQNMYQFNQPMKPYKEQRWMDKSNGQYWNEMNRYRNYWGYQNTNQSYYGNMMYGSPLYGNSTANMYNQQRWTQSYEKPAWMNYNQQSSQHNDRSGIVAMFYTDDGKPLFGPTPVVS